MMDEAKGRETIVGKEKEGGIPKKKKTWGRRVLYAPLMLLGAGLLSGPCLLAEQSNGFFQHYLGRRIEKVLDTTPSFPKSMAEREGRTRGKIERKTDGKMDEYLRSLSFPSLENISVKLKEGRKNEGDILVLDREEQPLAEFRNLSRLVAYSQISPRVVMALKAAEDQRFDYHHGWDLGSLAVAAAGDAYLKIRGVNFYPRGASGITLQLADILLDDEPDWKKNKIKEWLYATWLEEKFSKEDIITHFLNLAYFGYSAQEGPQGHLVGIESAARHYFGKPAAEVDWTEAVLLTAMVKKPTTYGTKALAEWQAGNREGICLEKLVLRARYIADRLKTNITDNPKTDFPSFSEADYDDVRKRLNYREFDFQSAETNRQSSREEEFTTEVKKRLYLLNGKEERLPGRMIVRTTLDAKLQAYAQSLFRETLQELRKKAAFPHPEMLNGGIVVIDTQTDEVLAMVGGLGQAEGDFLHRAAKNYLLPGSAFKHLMLAFALDKGLATLDEEFLDRPMTFYLPDAQLRHKFYSPKNFREKWSGQPQSLYEATVSSINGIFVQLNERVLNQYGRGYVQDWLKNLGLDLSNYTLASVLGTNNTSLLRLAGAYAVFPSGGRVRYYSTGDVNLNLIRSLEHEGRIFSIRPVYEARAISEETARAVDKALLGVVESGTGAAARMEGYDLRGKTGTGKSSFMFIGYEPVLHTLVAAHFASDDPSKTGSFSNKYVGGEYAAPLVRKILEHRMGRKN